MEDIEKVAKDFGDVYYGEYTDITSHMAYAFKEGAKWQQKTSYNEEEVQKLLLSCKDRFGGAGLEDYTPDSNVIKWFEQIKK